MQMPHDRDNIISAHANPQTVGRRTDGRGITSSAFFLFPIFLSVIFLSAIGSDGKMADWEIGSNRRPVQFDLERMDFAAQVFKLFMIMRRQSLFPLFSQLLDLRFDHGSVNSFGVMVSEGVDVESLADRGDQMLFVELRITLHRVVHNALRNFAQLRYGFVFEFFV